MENLLFESIRAAVASDATPEVRAEGIAACRTILATLESLRGEPIAPPIVTPNPAAIAAAVGALRGVPAEQLLDLAIAKLRAALPTGVEGQATQPLKFHLIPRAQVANLVGKTP